MVNNFCTLKNATNYYIITQTAYPLTYQVKKFPFLNLSEFKNRYFTRILIKTIALSHE